jgi:hypothetical protein
MQEDKTICPYCGEKMSKWKTPPLSTWTADFFYVCFNDKCSYFIKGWKHMQEHTQTACSYRHRYDPETGMTGPLPVWSPDACKQDIIEDEAGA